MLAVASLRLLCAVPSCFYSPLGRYNVSLRPLAAVTCVHKLYCSTESTMVPALALFCPYLGCDLFLVIGAGCVSAGACVGLLLWTVVADISNGMLLLSVSATRR